MNSIIIPTNHEVKQAQDKEARFCVKAFTVSLAVIIGGTLIELSGWGIL